MFDYAFAQDPRVKEQEDKYEENQKDQEIIDRVNTNYTMKEMIEIGVCDVDQEYEAFVSGSFPASYPDSSKIFQKMLKALTVQEAIDMLFISEGDLLMRVYDGELEL